MISENAPMPAEVVALLRTPKRFLSAKVRLMAVQFLFKERRQVPCASNAQGKDILYHQTLNQN